MIKYKTPLFPSLNWSLSFDLRIANPVSAMVWRGTEVEGLRTQGQPGQDPGGAGNKGSQEYSFM